MFHGTFVASGGTPYYSTDGKTWHLASVEDPSHILTKGFMEITAWSGGLLAVSNEGNLTHWSSKDGTSWTQTKAWQGPTYALGYSHGSGIVAAISGPTTADPESPDGTFWWWSADSVTWERIEGPSPCLGVWRVGELHLAAGPPVDSQNNVSLWLSTGGSPIWHRISGTAPYELKRPRIAGAIGGRVVILELLVTGDQPSGATAWYGDLVEK